jgi:dienelactone hydrolase
MRNAIALALIAAALAVGCARPTRVTYLNVTPDKPESVSATVTRPAGPGPFPAVVLLHGCGGVSPQLERWARWLADRGYVGMVVDSFGAAQGEGRLRARGAGRHPHHRTARRRLRRAALAQSQPWVRGDRVGAVGFFPGRGLCHGRRQRTQPRASELGEA